MSTGPTLDTTHRELKKLEDETGLFGSITDEEIASNKGKTYQDATALRDPLAGLGYGEGEATGAFEGDTQDAAVLDGRYIQFPNGKMNGSLPDGGQRGKIGKTKYAPSPQRNCEGVNLKPKTYARLTGTLNTRFPGLEAGETRIIRDAKYEYLVRADGYGGFQTLSKRKI